MPKRPNILLITSDQQHFDTLGFANPTIKTPHLDRLTREGTNFKLGNHGLIAKAFMYEDNVRLPFLIRWPGHVPAGQSSDAIQGLVDLEYIFHPAIFARNIMHGSSSL
jgi:arylsulfatase A-like enzyme